MTREIEDTIKYGTTSAIWSVAVSDDGNYLVATSGYPDLSLSLFNKNAELLWRQETGGLAKCSAISDNGDYIVTGIYARKGTGNVLFYNRNGRLLWRYQTRKKIESVALSKNSEYIAISSRDGTIYLFAKGGKLQWSRKTRSWNERVIVFIYNDIVIAISHQGSFYFYSLKGKLLRRYETDNIIGTAAMLGPDYVLTGYGEKTVFLIERNGELAWKNKLNSTPYSIGASKSGRHIAIGLEDGRVLLANREGKLLWEYKINGAINSVTVSREGECIVAGSNDFNLSVLAKSGKLLWKYKIGYGIIQKISDEKIAMEAIVQAQSMISEAKQLKIDVLDAEKLLEHAKEFEKKGEYENTIKKAEDARKLADKRKKKYIKERAEDTIALARTFIRDAEKMGIDISEANKILKRAEIFLMHKEYESARANALKAREVVKELTEKSGVNIAKNAIFKAEKIINENKKLGIDLDEAVKYLQSAKVEEKRGAYKKAIEFANIAERKVKIVKKRYLRKEILDIILSAQSTINELKLDGIDVLEVENLIKLANREVEKENYKKAEKIAINAKEKASELKKMSVRERAANIIVRARHIMMDTKSLGANIKNVEKLLENSEKSMDDGKYEKAIDFAKKAISMAEELKYSYLMEDVKKAISIGKKVIEEAKEIGADVSNANHLIREAEILFDSKEYEKALSFAKKSEEEAKNAKDRFLEKGALEIIKKAQFLVVGLKKKGIVVKEAEELLQRAIVTLESKEQKKAVEIAKNSIKSAKNAENEYNLAVNEINDAKSIIKQTKTYIDTRDSEKILNMAVEFLNNGDYKKSFETAKLARDSAIKAQENYANTLKIINLAKEVVNKFKNSRVNVSEAEKLLNDAVLALKSGNYEKAVSYATVSKKSAEDAGKEHSKTIAIINDARETIEEIKNSGIDVKEAENLLSTSLTYFKNGDYQNAVNFARKGQECAKLLTKQYTKALEKIKGCKSEVFQIKSFGVNVTKAEEMIVEAISTLRISQENALQLADNAVVSAKNSYKRHKESIKIIEEKNAEIIKIKKAGIEVFEALEIIEKAKLEVKNGNYNKAAVIAKKALNLAKMAQHRFVGENALNLINNAVSLIKRAEEIGADTNKAKAILKKAKFLYETESYKEAIFHAKSANLKAQKSIENFKKAKELVNKGRLLHNNKRYEEALQCFDEAISLSPNYKTFYFKAESLERLGKYRIGLECLEKVLIQEPNFEKALYLKGIFLNHLSRFNEAIVCFSKALEINPNMELGWYNKGVALDEIGEHEEAVDCYRRALKIRGFPEAWYNLGVATYNCKRYEEAIGYYDRALKLCPKYEAAWYNKGEALRELKRFKEALFCFENALQINPYNQKAIKERENCLMELQYFHNRFFKK